VETGKKNRDMSKAAILLSGGMDSATLLHYMKKTIGCSEIDALTFYYGQKHSREMECAEWQATSAGIRAHVQIDLSCYRELIAGASALTDTQITLPDLTDLSHDDLDQPPSYVPNRNMVFLSLAVAYAEARGIEQVFFGAQMHDRYGYWDCTPEFIERMKSVLALGRRKTVLLRAPFIAMSKSEELLIGLKAGVDYAHTWTCYRGQKKACGSCPACVERLSAFEKVGVRDPVLYKKSAAASF